MVTKSESLKKKIDVFKSNFLSKDTFIKYEENQFDKLIGLALNGIIKVSLPTIKYIINFIMKIIDKFLNYISQQNELKLKISKQEEILAINTKLNKELSLQIKQLNNKIDNLKNENKINLHTDYNYKNKNQIFDNNNTTEINNEKNNEIKFFQEENLRISNELFETKTKFEIMKSEMEKFQEQRSNLINKINSINEAVEDSNVVTSVFENNHNRNKINIQNFNKKEKNLDLNKEVQNIFAKS